MAGKAGGEMKFAIMECVVTPGGHEIDFDRILVEELTALGHAVEFYVPEGHEFKWNYGVPVHHIAGQGVSYSGAKGLKKVFLSAKREINRQRWYLKMNVYAKEKAFDAIIFPSATYRYLRALAISPLKDCPVPVLFLIHGVTPKEAVRLSREADKFIHKPNVRIGVQTFAKEKLALNQTNIRIYAPPNYIPRDIDQNDYVKADGILRLGFFGQYRKEKKLDEFLRVYKTCNFTRPVKLIIQGATQTPSDAEDFNRIIKKYAQTEGLEFWHRALIGIDWQKGLASVDAIVMPYGNDRYLYHTSAILSNAIGYKKSVINADNVNPEVLKKYGIGMSFQNGNQKSLKEAIETFVNTYDQQAGHYQEQLQAAYTEFAPAKLAANIAALAQN